MYALYCCWNAKNLLEAIYATFLCHDSPVHLKELKNMSVSFTSSYRGKKTTHFLALLAVFLLLAVPVESSFAGPMMPSPIASGPIRMPFVSSINQQQMAVSGTNVYLMWTTSTPTGENQIFFKRSIDSGKTFENQISLGNVTNSQDIHMVASGNNVYVSWSLLLNNTSKVFVKYSSDGGMNFQQVSPSVGDATLVSLVGVETYGNTIQLLWLGSIGPNRTQVIALSQSHTGGSSFDPPLYVSDTDMSSGLPVISHTGSNTYVEWISQGKKYCNSMYDTCPTHHFFRPIVDGTLGTMVSLDSFDENMPIRIASDQNTVFVEGLKRVYQNGFFKNSVIMISKSIDGGRSFSSTSLNSDVNMADISLVISNGVVYQFWTVYDNGFAPAPISLEKSTDGGKTFDSPVNLSGKTIPLGYDLSNQIVTSDGNLFAMWPGTDEAGASHVFFTKVDSPNDVRIISDVSQAGQFSIGAQGSTVYASFLDDNNLIFEKIDDSSYASTDFTCNTNQNMSKESLTMNTPQILISDNPVQNVLVGWKSQIKSSLQNMQDSDLNIVYHVQASKDGTTVWHMDENTTLLCSKSLDAKINWSPQEPGNYTVQTSIINPTNQQVISSNSTTIFVSENHDLQTFTNNASPVIFKILNQTVQVNQEGFAKFLLQAESSSPNYKLNTVNLSIDSPPGVQAWFDQYAIYSFDNSPQNLTMYVYADSGAKPDINSLKIQGKGSAQNLVTGEYFNIGNPISPDGGTLQYPQSILDQQQGYTQIGTVDLNIVPITPKPITYLTVGPPDIHPEHFCTPPASSSVVQSCMGFVGYEKFPINVYSDKPQTVTLDAKDFPHGGWYKFEPQELVATPQGTPSTLIVASVVKPFLINVLSNHVVRLYANSSDGNSFAYLPLTEGGNPIKILNSTGPIEFGSLTTNINNTTPNSVGIVYDSNQSSASLPISLSVLGVVNNATISPMPSWLSVDFLPSAFTLNSSQPYYFAIDITTIAPPIGSNTTVAIGEEIGTKNYTGYIPISIPPPVYMGPVMGAPPSTSSLGTINSTQETNSSQVHTKLLPPLKIFKTGMSVKDIACSEGFDLVEKKENGSPACIKSQTESVLLDRGWAEPVR